MKIILFSGDAQEKGNELEGIIHGELPQIQVEKINSTLYLKEKLCRPLNRISVIVVFVNCESDIDRLFSLRPLFDGIRLILVFPDGENKMISQGLGLNPCFVSYSDSDPSDITLVLKKIDQRIKNNIIKKEKKGKKG
jgi:hypothetical protein